MPILRHKRPDLKRAFTVPWSPFLPLLAAVASVYLMFNLSIETWIRFLVWMALGFVIYFVYGYRRSRLSGNPKEGHLPSMTST